MSSINKDQLEKMVKESECDNNTDKIRELKHSKMIKENIDALYSLKATHSKMRVQEPDKFDNLCKNQCSFLYTHYTLIYNKAFNDELDLKLLDQLLNVLENIEDGKTDQHNGSVAVGEILKKIYIDSALRKSEKLDKEYASEKPVFVEPKPISYKEFKNRQ
tara:strand:+ start:383 stop:865 length:483 start_codon:yes stop_codon:yes gene_type:complete